MIKTHTAVHRETDVVVSGGHNGHGEKWSDAFTSKCPPCLCLVKTNGKSLSEQTFWLAFLVPGGFTRPVFGTRGPPGNDKIESKQRQNRLFLLWVCFHTIFYMPTCVPVINFFVSRESPCSKHSPSTPSGHRACRSESFFAVALPIRFY